MLGAPGFGLSDSSVRGVLQAGGKLSREGRWPLDLDKVEAMALADERRSARGRAIAADDVIPIVRGRAVEVYTFADGSFTHKSIDFDPEFIRRHLIFAYDPTGQRHDVPDLLESLFTHPKAGDFVTEISDLALQASQALRDSNIHRLANAVQGYVELFEAWTRNRMVHQSVQEIADQLQLELGGGFLGWKPPGAGGASSLLALVEADVAARALDKLDQLGWEAMPVNVSPGLHYQVLRGGRQIRLTVPHRVDLVGGADLGQDREIGVDGVCCSIAIEPRCTLTLTFPEPRFGPGTQYHGKH